MSGTRRESAHAEQPGGAHDRSWLRRALRQYGGPFRRVRRDRSGYGVGYSHCLFQPGAGRGGHEPLGETVLCRGGRKGVRGAGGADPRGRLPEESVNLDRNGDGVVSYVLLEGRRTTRIP